MRYEFCELRNLEGLDIHRNISRVPRSGGGSQMWLQLHKIKSYVLEMTVNSSVLFWSDLRTHCIVNRCICAIFIFGPLRGMVVKH